MRAGIIAAGEGSRLGSFGLPKPLVRVGGMTLIERTLRNLVSCGVEEVALIARDREVIEHAAGLGLPVPLRTQVKATPSSLHSLHELGAHLAGERFLLCTVDSIVRPAEMLGFARRFEARRDLELLLSYTDFVDDEKPLRIAVDPATEGVTALGERAAKSPFVTVGLYGVGPGASALLGSAVQGGMEKLRNFLGHVLISRLPAAGFRLSKAIDVDRPQDVEVAEAFLEEG